MRINAEGMASALRDDLLATELADYLVRQGVPFRQGHHIVGQVVRAALAKGCGLRDLTVDDYRAISPHFGDDVHEVLDFRAPSKSGTCPAARRLSLCGRKSEQARNLLT